MKQLLTILALSTSLCAHAQIHVGTKPVAVMNKAGDFSPEDIERLKKTTTLFTLQFRDYNHQADFEKVIAAVWKITPYKIIKADEMKEYMDKDGYSIFSFGGSYSSGKSNEALAQDLTYDLWIPKKNKGGEVISQDHYARIALYPDADIFRDAVKNYSVSEFEKTMIDFLYNQAVFYNWGPGYLKSYLTIINNLVTNSTSRSPYTNSEEPTELKRLKTDTLYVPDYVNIKFNPLAGTEKTYENAKNDSDIVSAYPFPLKYVSSKDLNDRILSSDKPLNYLLYIKSTTNKFIDVFNTGTGLIYARYTKLSYNFKMKDFERLAEEVQ